MKKMQIDKLDLHKPEDQFSQDVAKADVLQSEIKAKSYSLERRQIDYINSVALQMTTAAGKPVSVSAALRQIVNYHRENIK